MAKDDGADKSGGHFSWTWLWLGLFVVALLCAVGFGLAWQSAYDKCDAGSDAAAAPPKTKLMMTYDSPSGAMLAETEHAKAKGEASYHDAHAAAKEAPMLGPGGSQQPMLGPGGTHLDPLGYGGADLGDVREMTLLSPGMSMGRLQEDDALPQVERPGDMSTMGTQDLATVIHGLQTSGYDQHSSEAAMNKYRNGAIIDSGIAYKNDERWGDGVDVTPQGPQQMLKWSQFGAPGAKGAVELVTSAPAGHAPAGAAQGGASHVLMLGTESCPHCHKLHEELQKTGKVIVHKVTDEEQSKSAIKKALENPATTPDDAHKMMQGMVPLTFKISDDGHLHFVGLGGGPAVVAKATAT